MRFKVNAMHSQLNSLELSTSSLSFSADNTSICGTSVFVKVQTLDQICSELNIDSILLLKIDVEGAESLVLEGADSLISSRNVKFIQVEYSRQSIVALPFFNLYMKYQHLYDFSILCSNGFYHIDAYSSAFEAIDCAIFFMELKQ